MRCALCSQFLDLLSRARSPTSAENGHIVSFLRETLPHLRARRERAAQRHAPHLASTAPRPGTVPVLTRDPAAPAHAPVFRPTARPLPLAQLGGSGVRRVPRLDHADGAPFLRLGRPQPRELSRVLRQRHMTRDARYAKLAELQEEALPEAAVEDQWDRAVQELMRRERQSDKCEGNETFVDPVRAAIWEVREKIDLDSREKVARGKALWELVLQEKALAQQEQRERRERREETRKERREERLRAHKEEEGTPVED